MQLNIDEPWFTAIFTGTKTIEARLNTGKWKKAFDFYKENDYCSIFRIFCTDIKVNNGKERQFQVIAIHNAKTFKELYEKFGEKLLPKDCLKEGEDSNIYYKFYSKEDEEKYGVLGFELEYHDTSQWIPVTETPKDLGWD